MQTHEAFLHRFVVFKILLQGQNIPFVYLIRDEEPIQSPGKYVLGFCGTGFITPGEV